MEHTYGEYLFEAVSDLIVECLAGISEEDVRDTTDYKVFKRGQEYYQEGMVEELVHNTANNTVVATVKGTREYQIEFYQDEDVVYSTCDCPYEGVCKHTVAALLSMIHEGTENMRTLSLKGPATQESLAFLEKYLKSLSRESLIQLVKKFAPIDFVTEIRNREISAKDADAIFKKAESKIRRLFEDDELLYDPGGMEDALMSQLNNLKGLEDTKPDEIGELVLFIIQSIEIAFNDGYLYLDGYPQDEYFESEAFCEYVVAFVRHLSFERKIRLLPRLSQALNEMSYDTFSAIDDSFNRFFSEKERARLKTFVTSQTDMPVSLVSRLFRFLEPELDNDEKESILRLTSESNHDHLVALVNLLYEQNRFREIIDLLSEEPYNRFNLGDYRVAEIYMEAAYKLKMDMDGIYEEIIAKCPEASVLRKIKSLKGTVSTRCEEILRELNPEDLLEFYEKGNRLRDALEMVLEPDLLYDGVILGFFKKNHKHFPMEAESFLKGRIEGDLKQTGMNHYERIAESLALMKRINPERAGRIAGEIREKFKRRSNLMQIIRGY